MDTEELLVQDRVAKQWIKEIDSFKSPPPPRRLADLNSLESSAQRNGITASTTPASSVVHSRDGSYCTDNGQVDTGRNGEELPPENFIVEKVRQFEDNDAHPYANRRRVETSKKIAAQGGNLAAFLINDKSKQRISKEEASKLRATVLQENRVFNPYPSPYTGSVVPNNENARRADPSNSSGGSGSSSVLSPSTGGNNGDRYATSDSLHPQTPIQKAVDRRFPSHRSLDNPSGTAAAGASSQRTTHLSTPTATINGSSPCDDRLAAPSRKEPEHHLIGRDTKASAVPSNRNGTGCATVVTKSNSVSTPIKNLNENNTGGIINRNGDNGIRNQPIVTPSLGRADDSVEDEEMEKLYRTFDAELERVGLRQKQRDQEVTDKTANSPIQAPAYGQYRRRHPLPPYTGIRQQSARMASSESPIPSATVTAPRSLFSPPATARIDECPPPRPPSPITIAQGGSILPPVPNRKPQRHWIQHYAVPRPPLTNSDETASRSAHNTIARENGFHEQNVSAGGGNNSVPPPAPPPPPPPPAVRLYTRRPYGATPIADRIPAQQADHSSSGIARSASHTAAWTEHKQENGSVAVQLNNSGRTNGDATVWQQNPTKLALNRAASNGSTDNFAAERQQRMWNDFEKQVVDDLEQKAVPIGLCYNCGSKVTNPLDATQALGHLYHAMCFTCFYCGRPLKGKKFYEARGKVYCEEDYLYSGFQQSAERCAACGHLIMDMILQAVGRSFHPGCFKCHECRRGLENVPFTVDDQGLVYCIDDYHRLFAPRCAKCHKPITPTNGREETVRVVAMQRDYHIDCYACEGCGLRLTDEDEKRCYPLGEHLLCQRCHVYWSRTGGASQPITDL